MYWRRQENFASEKVKADNLQERRVDRQITDASSQESNAYLG